MANRTHTLIVGGGMMGLATAFELARRGHRITVLERNREVGAAAAAITGLLAPKTGMEGSSAALSELGADSLERFSAWVKAIEAQSGRRCEVRDEGALWVAFNADEEQQLKQLREQWKEQSVPAVPLSAAEVLAREPSLSPRVHGGWWVPGHHQIEPQSLLTGLAEATQRLGGQVVCDSQVREIVVDGCQVMGVLMDEHGTERFLRADNVVLAAGAWSSLTIDSPYKDLGVRAVRSQAVALRGPALIKHVVRTLDVCLVPHGSGELLIGANTEERGFGALPAAGVIMHLLAQGTKTLPGLRELSFFECAVTVRPMVADHLPVIGADAISGLYVNTAHYRDGILLAPATAHHLADYIVSGQMPTSLAAFSPKRLLTDTAEGGAADDERAAPLYNA